MAQFVESVPTAQMPAVGGPTLVIKTDADKNLWHDADSDAFYPANGWISGYVVFATTATETVLGTIPANCIVDSIEIVTITAFNAATTNTISVGYTTALTQYAGATDVTAVGRKTAANGATAGAFTNGKGFEATKRVVRATFLQTGTAATTGNAIVALHFTRVA